MTEREYLTVAALTELRAAMAAVSAASGNLAILYSRDYPLAKASAELQRWVQRLEQSTVLENLEESPDLGGAEGAEPA